MEFYRPPLIQGALDALGSVYRALRAWKFYPKGHPSRKSSIKQAHAAMLLLLNGNNLSLLCGRASFSFPDGERIKDVTRMSASLSYELFIRRIQKITFLNDLYQEDLLDFIRIITIFPDALQQAGGAEKLMAERGIRTIWVNEIDLSNIRVKRHDVESRGVKPPGVDEIESDEVTEGPGTPELLVSQSAEANPEEELHALLMQLAATRDEDNYLAIVHQSIACADALKAQHIFTPLFPLVELLAAHAGDDKRGPNLMECARFGLEQLAMGEEFLDLLLERMEGSDGVSKEATLAILSSAGPAAIKLAVEKMGATDNLVDRKALITLIVRLGEQAVQPLLAMMGDKRWYIVRNLASILGDIGHAEAVPELHKYLQHSDIRVSKECIRSLAKIGGKEAESAIISILRGSATPLQPQAIISLGGMKSKKAVLELMRIIYSEDMFLKNLPLKSEALVAIAMIGDRQVTPLLVELLGKRHLMARSRWEQFKIAIAHCLGKLGDPRALPALQNIAASAGALGQACAKAAESIELTGGAPHGGA
jgi:HEAT repeat protein